MEHSDAAQGDSATVSKPISASCISLSMASISSEGSVSENAPTEQEEIVALTHYVRLFKEALAKLKSTFQHDNEKTEKFQISIIHERLGEVLRILKGVLEKYPTLQCNVLSVTAGNLIQIVKDFKSQDEESDWKEFFDSIDHLALAFSRRVSEYLMGDLETILPHSPSSTSCKTKSCENLAEKETPIEKKIPFLLPEEIDPSLVDIDNGVEFALRQTKSWSKFIKELILYTEKRIHLELEYKNSILSLNQSFKGILESEGHLPMQDIYLNYLKMDIDNIESVKLTGNLILGTKVIEPLNRRRLEHENRRKEIKGKWHKELNDMRETVLDLRATRDLYLVKQQQITSNEDRKNSLENIDKKKMDDKEMTKLENIYVSKIKAANEKHTHLYEMKKDILKQIRELITESDAIFKEISIVYFQLQHNLNLLNPGQVQMFSERGRSYVPGSEYLDYLHDILSTNEPKPFTPNLFNFESSLKMKEPHRHFCDAIEAEGYQGVGLKQHSSWTGVSSDTDSVASSLSNKSLDHSPGTSPKSSHRRRSDQHVLDLDTCQEGEFLTKMKHHPMSKAAETHHFRKLKTPSRCRECDSYVYLQGVDCNECGLAVHKKCLSNLAIQCGHKRLPRKMTTFGVDLGQHLADTGTQVPHLVIKCLNEIDKRGIFIKGIYRVSGVKSKVEKLCQAFENGADLVDLSDIHPNVIANVLKLYLRQLPEPLLTFRLYPEFVRLAKTYALGANEGILSENSILKELVFRLPRHHFLTLGLLMQHLKYVASFFQENNMPPSNLGIVFGPTLLRTAEGSASLSSLVDTVHQTRAIQLLIEHAHEIFDFHELTVIRETPVKICNRQPESSFSLGLVRSFSFIDRKKPKEVDPERKGEQKFNEVAESSSTDNIPRRDKGKGIIKTDSDSKIFKGSLKDYQGLEGLNSAYVAEHNPYENEMINSIKSNVKLMEYSERSSLSPGQELRESSPSHFLHDMSHIKSKRTESSADSDYSFDSHSSQGGNVRERDIEESADLFSSASWTKKSSVTFYLERKSSYNESPQSSLSQSLDESQGSEANEECSLLRKSHSK